MHRRSPGYGDVGIRRLHLSNDADADCVPAFLRRVGQQSLCPWMAVPTHDPRLIASADRACGQSLTDEDCGGVDGEGQRQGEQEHIAHDP